MLTNQEIFARHPELMELREFKTNEEIVQAFKNGCTMWEVRSLFGAPARVAESPKEIIGVGTYDDEGASVHGSPVYYYYRPSSLDVSRMKESGFIVDLQCVPGKAVFTSRERAEAYFAAAQKTYESDPEWQAEVERTREHHDRAFPFPL